MILFILFFITKIVNSQGDLTDLTVITNTLFVSSHWCRAPVRVLLFPRVNKLIFGYFDPEKIFTDNENK